MKKATTKKLRIVNKLRHRSVAGAVGGQGAIGFADDRVDRAILASTQRVGRICGPGDDRSAAGCGTHVTVYRSSRLLAQTVGETAHRHGALVWEAARPGVFERAQDGY